MHHNGHYTVRFPLLQLPDPCLVAVLRCCAVDHRSVCSAARAHSRLHQAAVEALSTISLTVGNQQQLGSLVKKYLSAHGQHVDSISLEGGYRQGITLRQLPSALPKLSSLEFSYLTLQLQPGDSCSSVLGAAAASPLKQLRLDACTLLDGGEGLAAALALLPGLEHLGITESVDRKGHAPRFPLGVLLPGLQQLTYLELAEVQLGDPDGEPTAVGLQHLSALTRLADLRLRLPHAYSITASALSGAQHLTQLQLLGYAEVGFEPAALAGKTLLQHLELLDVHLLDGATGVAQLLSQLQQLTQLTCLELPGSILADGSNPRAAAFSALTASSRLQQLDVSNCTLPAGVWQHVFPAGRQLPNLQGAAIYGVSHPEGPAAAPEGSRLVSCCPGLQSLHMAGLQYSRGLLAALQGLSGLTQLTLRPSGISSDEGLQGVCQLTGLRYLCLDDRAAEGLLLQLTQLRQLTCLFHHGLLDGQGHWQHLQAQNPGDEPVWRQLLRHYLNHSDPEVAQQAAAALAE